MNQSQIKLIRIVYTIVLILGSIHVNANDWLMYNHGRFDTLQEFSLNAIRADGTQQIKLADGAFMNPVFSPDGQALFMSVPVWIADFPYPFVMIYCYSVHGVFTPYRITPFMGWTGDSRTTTLVLWAGETTVSPDQSRIIYRANLLEPKDISVPIPIVPQQVKTAVPKAQTISPKAIDPRSFLAIANTDGSSAFAATALELPGQAVGYAWSHSTWHPFDPTKILVSFINSYPGYQDWTLYIVNPEGAAFQPVLNPVYDPFNPVIERHYSPAWSPDGQQIAYVRQVNRDTAVFIVRADGSNAPGVQITSPELVNLPAIPGIEATLFEAIKSVTWSPDGKQFAFCVYSKEGAQPPMGFDLYTVNIDGSGLTRLTNEGMSAYPVWVPSQELPNQSIFLAPPTEDGSKNPTPIPPSATPTQKPVITNTPIPTAIPITTGKKVFDFSDPTLAGNEWSEIPGGFVPDTPAGTVQISALPTGHFTSSQDQKGLAITVHPKQVAFAYSTQPVNTAGKPVILRITLSANAQNVTVTLGVLKGSMQETDGSIATYAPYSAASFLNHKKTLTLVYQANDDNFITPVIQAASTSQTDPATIWIDCLEIEILEFNSNYSGERFHSSQSN